MAPLGKEWVRIHDGCTWARYQSAYNGRITGQRKRRAVGAGDGCTWAIPCDDHPGYRTVPVDEV